jgi:hypothetical protein
MALPENKDGKGSKGSLDEEIRGSYGKGKPQAQPQGAPEAMPQGAPAAQQPQAPAPQEEEARKALEMIANLPSYFMDGVTVLKGNQDNDILIVDDLIGRHRMRYTIPKRISKIIIDGLA